MVMGKRGKAGGLCPSSCGHSARCSCREVGEVPGQQLWWPWAGGGGDIPVFDEIFVHEGATPGSPGRRGLSKGGQLPGGQLREGCR